MNDHFPYPLREAFMETREQMRTKPDRFYGTQNNLTQGRKVAISKTKVRMMVGRLLRSLERKGTMR